MILQTGMRTDIPAFYPEWFANRLKEGYVCTRNPYNPVQVTKYRLSPDVVDVITFCTKNPAPMFPYLNLLAPYGQYWFVTITPYGTDIEPQVPPKEKVMADFQTLSRILGVHCIGWRYDPILLTETYPLERHIADFEKMAETLAGFTHTCVISFIDLYQKVRKNFPAAETVSAPNRITLAKEFVRIGKKYDIAIKSCAEGDELAPYGVNCDGCMTLSVYETAIGAHLHAPKEKSQRAECACLLGKDIGQYDTCGHFCRYCYANTDARTVAENRKLHDPTSPLLIGNLRREDQLHDAKQESWIDRQIHLFDLI